jgi:hypothetical protein
LKKVFPQSFVYLGLGFKLGKTISQYHLAFTSYSSCNHSLSALKWIVIRKSIFVFCFFYEWSSTWKIVILHVFFLSLCSFFYYSMLSAMNIVNKRHKPLATKKLTVECLFK